MRRLYRGYIDRVTWVSRSGAGKGRYSLRGLALFLVTRVLIVFSWIGGVDGLSSIIRVGRLNCVS